MTKIPNNFGDKNEKCICGAQENMTHIYICESINKIIPEISYDQIYNGNLRRQIEIFRRMEMNLGIRKQMKDRRFWQSLLKRSY